MVSTLGPYCSRMMLLPSLTVAWLRSSQEPAAEGLRRGCSAHGQMAWHGVACRACRPRAMLWAECPALQCRQCAHRDLTHHGLECPTMPRSPMPCPPWPHYATPRRAMRCHAMQVRGVPA